VAEGRSDLYGDDGSTNSHRLRFVVLAYADLVQIVAPFGRNAYVSVAIGPEADAYALGTRLAALLGWLEDATPVEHECTNQPNWCVARCEGNENIGPLNSRTNIRQFGEHEDSSDKTSRHCGRRNGVSS
jgi:hypothetical protein